MDMTSSLLEDQGMDSDEHGYDNHKSEHAFRTISEVSQEIDVPQHVLRFWESKFSQIRPLKRGGGRRYYRPEDIELIRRIKNYLYKQGYTIKGVQRLLKDKKEHGLVGASPVTGQAQGFVPYANPSAGLPAMPAMPIPTHASMLHAAATAPSALAMAYGAIAGQVQEGSTSIKAARFSDAFAEATAHIAAEGQERPQNEIARSLEAVTKLYEDISTSVRPIRIINPAAPRLEDMEQDKNHVPVSAEPEFELPLPEAGAVLAVQPLPRQKEEVGEDEAVDTEGLMDVTEAIIAQDDLSPSSRGELAAILAELSSLRDMLRSVA